MTKEESEAAAPLMQEAHEMLRKWEQATGCPRIVGSE